MIFITKSKVSNTNKKISWNTLVTDFYRKSKNLEKLGSYGIKKLEDLLWVLPLRAYPKPKLQNFDHIQEDQLFLGEGELLKIKAAPAFGRKGRGKVQLFNITVIVKDTHSNQYLTLKWFNSYPNVKKQIDQLTTFKFLGQVSSFAGSFQLINPKINPKSDDDFVIEYPTINSVSGIFIKKYIDKIPSSLWEQNYASKLKSLYQSLNISHPLEALAMLHGKHKTNDYNHKKAVTRLIKEEFIQSRLKVLARKAKNKDLIGPKLNWPSSSSTLLSKFPYELTQDQKTAVDDIKYSFSKRSPMMRLLQGDVGCGKTTVALIASYAALMNKVQIAIMCPTEALARQHAKEFDHYLGDQFNIALLLGSTKASQKNEIYNALSNNEIQLIIGTHSLFQEKVQFFNLGFVIIDEQHKFGVKQRQALTSKGNNPHTLIMSATPIPRTLQLSHYGDLDISNIKTIPSNRKGIKTRIVNDSTYKKFLNFLLTRISLGEQVYVVVPAIEESIAEINNVENLFENFKEVFPNIELSFVHGKLKADDKDRIINDFSSGKTKLLVSTSVIEVGINVPNATVMAIYNPERFGLSSLHQLRGRVGRGEKPGFCFLVTQGKISNDSTLRLKVLEKTTDGFVISEEDLKLRGAGNLFGKEQSGSNSQFKLANFVEHKEIFEDTIQQLHELEKSDPEHFFNYLKHFIDMKEVTSTI